MGKVGTISLQALDRNDVFLKEDIYVDGEKELTTDDLLMAQPGFDKDKVWVTGNVPKLIPVMLDGDNPVIFGWVNSVSYPGPVLVKIYVQYEEVEQLIEEK